MSDYQSYDVIIIGGGPAGVTAALRASELGARTALIERDVLGGTCTNDGCVPTRVIAKAARLYRDTELFELYGLSPVQPSINFSRLLTRAQQVVEEVHEKKQLLSHLQGVGVDVFDRAGAARFASPHQVDMANGRTIVGQKIIICAGGQARRLPVPGGELALVHSDLWTMQTLPASVVIAGAGATGMQLATIFRTFGTQVTIIDLAARLLPGEDADVSAGITSAFVDQGIRVLTDTRITALRRSSANIIEVATEREGQEDRIHAEVVISAVGWPGNIDALNLSAAGVQTNGPYVKVDPFLRTSAPSVYAAGDITGQIMLVQTASQQARIAVENALSEAGMHYREQLVPHGGFTDPEYGAVGLTEAQAVERFGRENVVIARVPFTDIDRAVIDGRTEGFIKLLVHRQSHEVIGAHFVGEQAIELVNVVAAGMIDGLKVGNLAALDFAYPSFCAVIAAAARQIARELRVVPLVAVWRELGRMRIAEWERSG